MIIITKDNFKSEIEEFGGLAVIDLYADWCGPCRMLAPILAELEEEYPDVKFCKINVDSDLRLGFTAAVRKTLADNPSGFNPRDYLSLARNTMTQICIDEIKHIMGSENKAD